MNVRPLPLAPGLAPPEARPHGGPAEVAGPVPERSAPKAASEAVAPEGPDNTLRQRPPPASLWGEVRQALLRLDTPEEIRTLKPWDVPMLPSTTRAEREERRLRLTGEESEALPGRQVAPETPWPLRDPLRPQHPPLFASWDRDETADRPPERPREADPRGPESSSAFPQPQPRV
ncbi:hypothetical protein [Pseudoroseicyclus aestuarii]|uniref:Uncharacterized protein n=1 Tax=Pseudoroseicyclus aestuarii TaxID=1795041 RepID=A0A318T086_9RHOB|nr:hypothetical protein [Pseudoroseicyclus aestuarii]PYE86029.1 hypothetical protein DFP88_101704 [Pseudoroseicyclus aestuarii]